MDAYRASARSLVLLGGLGLGVAVAGCSHVSQEDLDARIGEIEQQIEEGDQENADRIDQTSQRVDDLESRVGSLENALESLESDFETTVQRLESALRFSTPVHFAYDKAEIRSQDEEYLDRFASVVEEYYPDATVTVEGFTDPAGSESYNMELGQKRANAVKSYLTGEAGLSGDRIRAVSYGENTQRLIRPDASGPGEAGLSNRRVVLVVDYAPRQGSGGMAGVQDGGSSTGSGG